MKLRIFGLFIFISTFSFGQDAWNKTNSEPQDDVVFVQSHLPSSYQLYELQITDIKSALQGIPKRYDVKLRDAETIVTIPSGNGSLASFKVLESPILEPALAAQFPMIKTFIGKGINDPDATLYLSIGTDGLHAMVLAPGKPTLYIDPFTRDRGKYIAYKKSDLPPIQEFVCEFENESPNGLKSDKQNSTRNIIDGLMRQYNLAVATTIEYSAFHLTNQGVAAGADSLTVKIPAVLSAITTTINRVKGIFEKELGVTFVLNANEAEIIFLTNDNFTNNSSSALINESQTVIDAEIGNTNYDVGHTFSTGGGGLASLGGICRTPHKARAITGSSNPIGDSYDVDFVAHEIGHHFGANHSYNGDGFGNCNTSNPATAAEPGSGSTIMAYAGICSGINVQQHSDPYFHIMSLQEINNRLTNAGGFANATFYPQCSSNMSTGNQEPVANAGGDYTIPKETAFILSGSATDGDNDPITYCWDQIDVEQPNVYPLVSTETTGPLYRSYSPTGSPKRFMPKFETVLGDSLHTAWEVTPTVGRNLNFSLTARDNRADGGQNTSDEMLVTVSDVAGPFKVTSQTAEETWATGQTKTITWDIAGTTANGVNAANVAIELVDHTGSVLQVLEANTPNDGMEDITVPGITSNNARVKVSGVNNIFYAINSANIGINTPPIYCSTVCSSAGRTSAADGTTLVNFNTINNTSTGAPAYSDYTSISTTIVKGQSYNLTVNVNSDGNYTELSRVWIDWNRDCKFDGPGEEFDLGSASNTPTTGAPTSNSPLSITVPATAQLGDTRMRVTSAYNGGSTPFTPTSCANNFYGEVEDYSLKIVSVLPVDLTEFKASIVDQKFVRLDWETATERNNAGFELERSSDGRNFEFISWTQGNGTFAGKQQYQYIDRSVNNNQMYYYRLKQVDTDGHYKYSAIQSAMIRNKDEQMLVYPNPATHQIFIEISDVTDVQNQVAFMLFDAFGRKIVDQELNQEKSSISIDHIPPGIYLYKVANNAVPLKSDFLIIN